jgi:hypothetical protein
MRWTTSPHCRPDAPQPRADQPNSQLIKTIDLGLIYSVTEHPAHAWVTQRARNLAMNLDEIAGRT